MSFDPIISIVLGISAAGIGVLVYNILPIDLGIFRSIISIGIAIAFWVVTIYINVKYSN